LIGIAYFQQNHQLQLHDPEAVFVQMGQLLFHPFLAGLMLAAVLAAVMSTVSSQLLVTSSALVEDIYKTVVKSDASDRQYMYLSRLSILVISAIALIFAWNQSETILGLVSFAWAGFGASFGPIVLLALYFRKVTATGALWGMITGAATVFIWGNSVLSEYLYEIVPGFLLNLVVTIIISILTYKPNEEIDNEFNQMEYILKDR